MMTTDSRSLLYLKSPTGEDILSSAIRKRGWNVDVAGDTLEATSLMERETYSVGLVQWDEATLDQLCGQRQTERMLEIRSSVNWVALLSGGIAPALSSVSRIISKYFYDYHTLPVDTDRLLFTLGHAHGMAEITSGATTRFDESIKHHEMVGQSPGIRALFKQINRVAASDLNVLIRGESGTGKELTAQAIHQLSRRCGGPFVAVNCGALPKDLIQAELFGHEKGAFTGAERRRIGRIETAQNGTLFLDEIGDLPLELQINLLRFLQEKTIERIGGSDSIGVDVRVIAATNVNLEKAVEEGRFREDLYYRLNVLHADLPPLRERGDDVELLANFFFDKFAKDSNPALRGFTRQAMEAIKAHTWPGNVRELVNRIQRAVVMCEGRLVQLRDLGLNQEIPNSRLITLAEARARAEKDAIETTLGAVRNNVSKAARHLNISRVTLYRLMDLHSIDWQRGTH